MAGFEMERRSDDEDHDDDDDDDYKDGAGAAADDDGGDDDDDGVHRTAKLIVMLHAASSYLPFQVLHASLSYFVLRSFSSLSSVSAPPVYARLHSFGDTDTGRKTQLSWRPGRYVSKYWRSLLQSP